MSSTNMNPIDFLLTTIDLFKTKLLTIKSMCEGTRDFNIDQAKSIVNDGLFDLVQIKHLNEMVQINCEKKKEECEKNQEDAGKENLDQKKYEYHLDLIENDIFNNKQLPKLPEINKVISEEPISEDKKDLEIFNNILLGRKRLDQELKELREEKKKNEGILKDKNNYIKDIPKYIELIEKDLNKAQKVFNDSKNI